MCTVKTSSNQRRRWDEIYMLVSKVESGQQRRGREAPDVGIRPRRLHIRQARCGQRFLTYCLHPGFNLPIPFPSGEQRASMERRTTYPKPYFYRSRSELYSAFRKTGAEVALNHFQVNMSSAITPTPSANEAYAPPHRAGAGPRILLLIAVAIIIVITAIRTWIWWRNDAGISFASGVMITMATDLKQGVFYRPLYDSRGYGGTRYFPLFFCLHALLLKLGLPILASAYLLSAAAIVVVDVGDLPPTPANSAWNRGWLGARR